MISESWKALQEAIDCHAESKFESILPVVFQEVANIENLNIPYILSTLRTLVNVYYLNVSHLLPYSENILVIASKPKFYSYQLLKLLLLFGAKSQEPVVTKIVALLVNILKVNHTDQIRSFRARILDCINVLKDKISR